MPVGTLLVEPEWHSEIPLVRRLDCGRARDLGPVWAVGEGHPEADAGRAHTMEQTLNTITPRTTKNILADVHTQRHTYRTQNPTQMHTQIPTRTQT